MTLLDRFLKYVSFDTQSEEESESFPSTQSQWELARTLERELLELGAENVRVDENCYVMAEIPSTIHDKKVPVLGFIAHMDTSPDASGRNVKPLITGKYDGGDIWLNREKGVKLSPVEFPALSDHIGETIISTDGSTLLGADDKAGVAEIMSLAEILLSNKDIKHGKICIAFTPDEEVGNGAERFDVSAFGTDVAYTVDGGEIGEIEYENFNGANCGVFIQGRSIHPGSAKNKMINAASVAMEFASLIPVHETPEHTEGYEGFYHLHAMNGNVESATLQYIIRDHDREKFEKRKDFTMTIEKFLNDKYGEGVVEVVLQDRYYNMKEKILPHMELIEMAEDAMEAVGITPCIVPIRGGTDGARLSYMGLPCPNLGTGGHNFHGPLEFCSLDAMDKNVRFLLRLSESFAGKMGF